MFKFTKGLLCLSALTFAVATARIFVGPLKPGRYPFFGEFHEKTAQGVLIAE